MYPIPLGVFGKGFTNQKLQGLCCGRSGISHVAGFDWKPYGIHVQANGNLVCHFAGKCNPDQLLFLALPFEMIDPLY
jgi:hypothetical protein